jgi:hypothetical protein
MTYWRINYKKSTEYILELEDTQGWFTASAKWDGCVDYHCLQRLPLSKRANTYVRTVQEEEWNECIIVDSNGNEHADHDDDIHFCNGLTDTIGRLREIQSVAYHYFEERRCGDHGWPIPETIESNVETEIEQDLAITMPPKSSYPVTINVTSYGKARTKAILDEED